MKDGLHIQHFSDNDPIIVALKKWVISAGADIYGFGIKAHFYH